jgi:hypothetical protein
MWKSSGRAPSLRVFTLAFALQLRKKHGKTNVSEHVGHNSCLHTICIFSFLRPSESFRNNARYFRGHQSVRVSCCPLPPFFARVSGMLGHPVVLKFSKTLLSTLVASNRSSSPVWYNRIHLCLCLTYVKFILHVILGSIIVYIYLSWGLFCK